MLMEIRIELIGLEGKIELSEIIKKNLILIIQYRPQLPTDKSLMKDGSIRSGSTNSSSQDFDRNNGINRMMSSLSIGEFANSSNLNRIDYAGIRVSHEHTDSGLGDQDYAYSSERYVYAKKFQILNDEEREAFIKIHIRANNF